MRRGVLGTAVIGALALGVLPVFSGPASSAPPTGSSAGAEAAAPTAQVWLTTPDRTSLMSDDGTVDFAPGGSDAVTITVDPSRAYQQMVGFGASITDSSARVLYRLDPATRRATMRDLFSPEHGNGFSVLRQPIGASDFVAGPHYTYDDVRPGGTDWDLSEFSIDHDRRQILPLLRQALALNPDLTVVASPWSPPAWLKTNDSLVAGRLIDNPRVYATYARYFVRYVRAYQRAGVPIDAITLQNEPQNRFPDGYPGMAMPVADQVRLASLVGPALERAGLDTEILAYDHNWTVHPADIENTPPGEDPELEYPSEVLDSRASRWVDGVAYHCYSGDPSRQTRLHRDFRDVPVWFTECSGSHGPEDPPAQVFNDTLRWHARNLSLGVTRNWGATVVNWNLALDPDGGPHHGGCGTCTGVVTVNDDGTVTRNAEYYTLGHLARFVRPGAERIASTSFGTTGWNGEVMDAAFRNPDGSVALVVHNENDEPRDIAIAQGDWSFDYTLPGGSLATFTWPASAAARMDDGRQLVGLGRADLTARPAVPEDPCCTGDVARNVIDDDASTRWTTGRPQRAGDRLQLDLGRRLALDRLVLDTGVATGDHPGPWRLLVRHDGAWHRVGSGSGDGQLTVLPAPALPVRQLRIVLTEPRAAWWSVADLRVYR